jgi:hypothetical protein
MVAYLDGNGAAGALLIFVVVWVICGGIGYAIGNSKGRAGAGLALGLFLGIIGIVIIAVMQPSARSKPPTRAQGSPWC